MKKIVLILTLFSSLTFLGSCRDDNNSNNEDIKDYYKESVQVRYVSDNFPSFLILDYENEEADIDFSKALYYDKNFNNVNEYSFKVNEVFRMNYSSVSTTFPQTYRASYIFLNI